MELLLAFLAGSILATVVTRWRMQGALPGSSSQQQPEADPAASAPQASSDSNPPTSPAAQLNALLEALDAIGDISAHPRDVAEYEAFRRAVAVLASSSVPLGVVIDYVNGANWMLSTVACAALAARSDSGAVAAQMLSKVPTLRPWPLYYIFRYFEKLKERPPSGALLLNCPAGWADNPIIPDLLAEHFTQRETLGDVPGFGDSLQRVAPATLAETETLLRAVRHPAAAVLLNQIALWRGSSPDLAFLQSVGRLVGQDLDDQLLVESETATESLAIAAACIHDSPPRSLLVSGEARCGKTSFVRLLAQRLAAEGWITFEAGGAALMAGQKHIGELEQRLRNLIAELAVGKKVLWYVPDFAQLAVSGTHQGQAASILDQLLPALVGRQIVLIGEISSSQLTKLLQFRPALRSTLELIRLRVPDDLQLARLARAFTARLATSLGVVLAAGVLDTATHLARHYLGTSQMPGALLDLLKLAAQRASAGDRTEVRREDLLATLSQLTGMPSLVLDDRERVDLAALGNFFSQRVIGQHEAVGAIVERVAMLKAGLTDPDRPIAVFLFAGPTGTGKTELAKAVAEFLFGAADRLIRLDMSEFQSEHSIHKVLGDSDSPESPALTQRVRRQPFCVVLLDEFEKAHPGVWDLFLQVFDDGRLSDAAGHTVDFRHALIILTSNLGATAHQTSGLGFASQPSEFSREQVLRAVNKNFRPEFVNRLDNVIVFQPLSRELMRGILAKELGRVLKRRGLRHREWAVEWESSALDFLLDKGFSPALGARPLKRAIDQHLLAPLAATMVEHRFPEGDQFLFVRSDGRAIQVEFVDPSAAPEVEPAASSRATITVAAMMLQARGSSEERTALDLELQALAEQMSNHAWRTLDAELTLQMRDPGFWERSDRHRVLARYALMDRVKAALQTALGLQQRLIRSIGPSGRCSIELQARLASQIYAVQRGIQDALSDAPVEVVVAVQPALDNAPDTAVHGGWRERLLAMYRAWAANRRLQVEELPGVSPSHNLLLISGFGAARTLLQEAGLHLLEHATDVQGSSRIVARVLVAPTPTQLPKTSVEQYSVLLASLQQASNPTAIVRRYRLEPSPLIRDVRNRWRSGRPELVLGGHFDLLGEVSQPDL